MNVSQRLVDLPASPIRKLVPLAQAAKKEGVKVYHLNIGDPDIETPKVMTDVLHNWQKPTIGYSLSQGDPEFLDALTQYYHDLGFTFIEPSHIQTTTGGSEAIAWAMFAVANPGEEILVFEPFYANYNSYAVNTGVKLVPITTTIASGFHLPSLEEIEKHITPKTRAILYCNPGNPTGTVYTKEEIEMLVRIAKKHKLFLLSDEVYREYAYDGKSQVSLFSYMKEIPEQAIVLESMSKRYMLCGIRIGALISLNSSVMAGVAKLGQARLGAGLVDHAVAAALSKVPASYMQSTHDEFDSRRKLLYEGLKKIPGVVVPKPEGAFYIIAGLPVADSEDFCRWLLTDFRDPSASSGRASSGGGQPETLMLAPAGGFYATAGLGKNEVRIAYVLNTVALTRCLELLTKALEAYKAKVKSSS